MTQSESKKIAKKLKDEKKYVEALEIYERLWTEVKDAWTGYFIAVCLRQTDQLDECREFHLKFNLLFPNMLPMKTELLWLDYKQLIKNYKNQNFEEDGEKILAQCDQYSSDTGRVYIKTVLGVVMRLDDKPNQKLKWLDKLDQSILDNNVFRFNDISYPADRKRYFIQYAYALISLGSYNGYIADQMSRLGFSGEKHTAFYKVISKSFNFEYDGIPKIYIKPLALVLKNLSEEINLRKKRNAEIIYSRNKRLSVSDLSHFKYCPVSYAINRTFRVYSPESWQKDEWKREKIYLVDRYKIFHKSKDIKLAFNDTNIEMNQDTLDKFNAIFESKIELNNATTKEVKIMEGSDKNISGAPDYIFLHPKGARFVVTEKFSRYQSTDFKNPFESDLIKHYSFIEHFNNYKLSFGLFLTWYYTHQIVEDGKDDEKKIVIIDYRLTKVSLDQKSRNLLQTTMNDVDKFSKTQFLEVNGQQLSQPIKCLNCSVISYCHHKTGRYNEVSLPYEILPLQDI
ncbi:hypothetical protein [Pedobacter antarcticus]|uniref:hypothetical protein n=1 Tax=Pedobacter antarcticus TaxID=34086 RepID=UPI000885D45C|nr:hypothetical protein [Pedobacter antarcticus]SDL84893.1 hypothetical protein SAMN04488084_102661 [Pedobacter antarcticus]